MWRCLGSAVLVAGACGCAKGQPQAFIMPAQEFFAQTTTLVLTPVTVPTGADLPDSVLTAIDSMIEATLHQSELAVVPAEEYGALWERIARDVGGLFDPHSGERRSAAFEEARRRLVEELIDRFDAPALLYPEIETVEAAYVGATAEWHGVSQPVMGVGRQILTGVLRAVLDADGSAEQGTVRALSLLVAIEHMDGRELYVHYGGLELLETIDTSGRPRAIASDELFTSRERLLEGVQRAIQPLVDGASPR